MKFTIDYDINDFLQYQLYTASKSKRIKDTRKKSWLITSACFIILSLVFYEADKMFFTYYFLFAGIISLAFFPIYQRKKYKKHYEKYVKENYSQRLDSTCEIDIRLPYIFTRDKTGESTINTSEIIEVNEISEYFFLKVSTNMSFILPKRSFDYKDMLEELNKMVNLNKIVINKELNWTWK
jgi:hypothetical protein